MVGLPFGVVGQANDTGPDGRRPRSLRDLWVLEASRVLAVPLAGALLGALGARVSKLEDLPRLDMYRRRGPYVGGEVGPERSAYFALMNHSKASEAFDVDGGSSCLDGLVASVDVVIENLGPKRATALGVAASVAPSAHPESARGELLRLWTGRSLCGLPGVRLQPPGVRGARLLDAEPCRRERGDRHRVG